MIIITDSFPKRTNIVIEQDNMASEKLIPILRRYLNSDLIYIESISVVCGQKVADEVVKNITMTPEHINVYLIVLTKSVVTPPWLMIDSDPMYALYSWYAGKQCPESLPLFKIARDLIEQNPVAGTIYLETLVHSKLINAKEYEFPRIMTNASSLKKVRTIIQNKALELGISYKSVRSCGFDFSKTKKTSL